MRHAVRRLLALAAVAVAPMTLAAQPQVYCPPGVFAGCLAIEVRETETGAVVRMQNLQGSLIGSDDVFRLSVNQIRINLTDPTVWLHSSDFSIGWPYVHENVPFVGRSGAALNGGAGADLFAPATTTLPTGSLLIRGITDRQLIYNTSAGGVLLEGCRNTTNVSVGRYGFTAATCPSQGLDGWLEIGLPYGLFDRTTNVLMRPITAADITVDWENTYASTDEQSGALRGCTAGVNCDVYSYAVVAVAPEPGTWALLGTGLLGLGGVAVRRRRGRA